SRIADQRHARRHRRPGRGPAAIRHHGRSRSRPRSQPPPPRPAQFSRRLTPPLNTETTRRSAFAALFAGLQVTRVPQIIVRVRGAKPALATVAENGSGFIARLIQGGDAATRRLGFFVGILAGCFRLHHDTRAVILLPNRNRGHVSGGHGLCAPLRQSACPTLPVSAARHRPRPARPRAQAAPRLRRVAASPGSVIARPSAWPLHGSTALLFRRPFPRPALFLRRVRAFPAGNTRSANPDRR